MSESEAELEDDGDGITARCGMSGLLLLLPLRRPRRSRLLLFALASASSLPPPPLASRFTTLQTPTTRFVSLENQPRSFSKSKTTRRDRESIIT